MNEKTLHKKLSNLPLGKIRYFESTGSTNDEALAWAAEGAPDLSIVIADEQTAGRGRFNRKWFTPQGTSLAFSIILHPPASAHLSRIVGLAGLAIADSLVEQGLAPRIKWPNDILLNGNKVAGILVEAVWSGADIDSLVVGMGVNVHQESVPPPEDLQFPATSMEAELGEKPDREELLRAILAALIVRRPQIDSDEFIKSWEDLLSFRGEQVQIRAGEAKLHVGELLGLEPDGSVRLRDPHGKILTVRFGDVSLRPTA